MSKNSSAYSYRMVVLILTLVLFILFPNFILFILLFNFKYTVFLLSTVFLSLPISILLFMSISQLKKSILEDHLPLLHLLLSIQDDKSN